MSHPPDDRYEEFLALFLPERDRVSRLLYSMVPNRADAEDLFQQCSLILWRKFPEYDRSRPFGPWASGVARGEALNALRTSGRSRLVFGAGVMERIAEARDHREESATESGTVRIDALRACVGGLPEDDRSLIEVAYGGGAGVKAWAEETGRALQTLYNRLGRLRRGLQTCVERRLAESGGAA